MNRAAGHFREESQTPEHEAMRKDDEYAYAAAWQIRRRRETGNSHQRRFEI